MPQFSDFDPRDSQYWWDKIEPFLKGKPKEVLKKRREGLEINPFYTIEDVKSYKPFSNKISTEDPVCRQWFLFHPEMSEIKMLFSEANEAGINKLGIVFQNFPSNNDLKLVESSLGEGQSIWVHSIQNPVESIFSNPKGSDFDGLSINAVEGFSTNFLSFQGDLKTFIVDWARFVDGLFPNSKAFFLDTEDFFGLNPNSNEELAASLSAYVNILDLLSNEFGLEEAGSKIEISVSIGTNFFLSLAKLRVAKSLINQVNLEFGITQNNLLSGIPQNWNKATYDSDINILRIGSELTAALAGGAKVLNLKSYDANIRPANSFSSRITRNIFFLLIREGRMDWVNDPASGSYFFETISRELKESTWKIFQEMESKGGIFSPDVISEFIDRGKSNKNELINNIESGRQSIIGSNKYPEWSKRLNPKEISFAKTYDSIFTRALHDFDSIRWNSDELFNTNGKLPCIFIFRLGDDPIRFTRANFIANFVAPLGLEMNFIDESGELKSIQNDDILIVASSDDSYQPSLVEDLVKRTEKVCIAGNPANREDLERVGVFEFIHIKSPLLSTLKKLNPSN